MQRISGRRRALSGSAITLVVSLGLIGPAFAADAAAKVDDEVIVEATGTNIKGVKPVGSEAISLDRSQIEQTGRVTIADVVRTLPQVQSLGFNETAIDTTYGGNFANSQAATASGNATRGNSINIRGLGGNNATLLLVDGRRIAPSGVPSSFQEAVQVPFAALERVEVIADGASAIYGSDAISGVINFVLRKRFQGLELTGRYNLSDHGDGWSGSAVFGHNWGSLGALGAGNLIVSYEHTYTAPILRGSFPQLRSDLRAFGGNDNRFVSSGGQIPAGAGGVAYPGNPGNIVVFQGSTFANPSNPRMANFLYYGLPSGLSGTQVPTASQVLAGLNNPHVLDRSDYEDYQPRLVRDQVAAFANQELNSWLSVYFEGFFTKRDSATRVFQSNNVDANRAFWVQVNPGTPYYINGLTGASNQPYYVQYNLLAHYAPNGGLFYNDNTETSYTTTAGLKAKLPHEWNGELYATYGANNACGICYLGSFVSSDTPVFLDQQVNSGFINPYASDPLTAAQIARISGSNVQTGHNYFTDTVLKFDGPLLELPGGAVKAAVGGEYTYWINRVRNGANRPCDQFVLGVSCTTADNQFRWDANARTGRSQWSAFGELYIPLVGPGNALPLVEALNVDVAVRHDRYSLRIGGTTNPKIGATWKVSQDLTFRGSWGTSFRAPGLQDTNPGVFSVVVQNGFFPNFSGDATLPTLAPGLSFANVMLRIGANPSVKPEKGQAWSVGFDLTPRFTPGLRISGTYYDITYSSRIAGAPGITYLVTPNSANTLAYARQFVTAVARPANCSNANPASWAPEVRAALAGDLYGPGTIGFLYGASSVTNPCGVQIIADARSINLAMTHQTGFDLSAGYLLATDAGAFTIQGTVNHIFKNDEQAFQGQAVNAGLDRIGYPVSWRGRATLGWFKDRLGANLSLNYVGSYANDVPIQRYVAGSTAQVTDPASRVPAWTTFDLNVNYRMPGGGGFWSLKDTRLSINVLNLFDKGAPVVLTGSVAADVSKHSVLGRQWQFVVTKAF